MKSSSADYATDAKADGKGACASGIYVKCFKAVVRAEPRPVAGAVTVEWVQSAGYGVCFERHICSGKRSLLGGGFQGEQQSR